MTTTGRWMLDQQDPMAGSDNPGSLNRYVYVGDDQGNYVDPGREASSRSKWMAVAGGAAVVARLDGALFASPTGRDALVAGLRAGLTAYLTGAAGCGIQEIL